jgi:hypothetical protein
LQAGAQVRKTAGIRKKAEESVSNGLRGAWVERHLRGKFHRAGGLLGLEEEGGQQGNARSQAED